MLRRHYGRMMAGAVFLLLVSMLLSLTFGSVKLSISEVFYLLSNQGFNLPINAELLKDRKSVV